ncbi:MAG: hypothetical protein K9J72_04615, partial [Synechococcus sp. Tobar2m-G35]|nr:hypothetical protein [Synechococcus sp. Tobar2m-G35]
MRPSLILAPHGTTVLEPLLNALVASQGLRLQRLQTPADLACLAEGTDLLAPGPRHDPVAWVVGLGAWRQATPMVP